MTTWVPSSTYPPTKLLNCKPTYHGKQFYWLEDVTFRFTESIHNQSCTGQHLSPKIPSVSLFIHWYFACCFSFLYTDPSYFSLLFLSAWRTCFIIFWWQACWQWILSVSFLIKYLFFLYTEKIILPNIKFFIGVSICQLQQFTLFSSCSSVHLLTSQFSSVQSLSRVQLFEISWTATQQASLSITSSQSLLKLMSIESVMPSNHLILCHPHLLLPSIFPSIRSFPVSQFFATGGQSIGVSASVSVLPMNIETDFL